MNSMKLYEHPTDGFVLKVDNSTAYHLTNTGVRRTSSIPDTEVPFDVEVQGVLDNAMSATDPNLVTDPKELNLIKAIVQEKIEDFD